MELIVNKCLVCPLMVTTKVLGCVCLHPRNRCRDIVDVGVVSDSCPLVDDVLTIKVVEYINKNSPT